MTKLTLQQVRKKYHDKYIEFYKSPDFDNDGKVYEVRKSYKDIHENTTLGQDVETEFEYRR